MFNRNILAVSLFFATLVFLAPAEALAYIGPGAGFVVAGSGLVFLTSLLMLLVTIVWGPALWAIRWYRGRSARKNARAGKVVIVGLDGLDPALFEAFKKEGLLPNLAKLESDGGYRRLKTTLPALSPVAWSSFQTGVNPGAHNIYDFITRDKRNCLPQLSSTKTESTVRKAFLGIFKRANRSTIRLLRGGQPFWKILGSHGIFSNVIRVPVSYPPEPFFGTVLSGMCTPDLRGSQGTFMFFSTEKDQAVEFSEGTGGVFHKFKVENNIFTGYVEGPEVSKSNGEAGRANIPFRLKPHSHHSMIIEIGDESLVLNLGELSEWVTVAFKLGNGVVASGIVKFCLRSTAPNCSLYISPVNVNPEKPILPISFPRIFSGWLAKKQGLFGTLGLLEDTWGRNELALDDTLFLRQSYATHMERERMFFSVLEKTRRGLCVCVFDASDRIQHMFWRYHDKQHPSPREDEKFEGTISEMYQRMDDLVGRIRAKLSPEDWLIVMSDHGFSSFRRCFNVNSWLKENGYLHLKDGAKFDSDYLQSVDWAKTKAYAIGLAGIFINKAGRERLGIVPENDYQSLKAEIARKLEAVTDPKTGEAAIKKVYDSQSSYSGIYTAEAPDLIVGYESGYRVSWDSVTGKLESAVFSDNIKAWSGDHHVDPSLVPGVLFSNRKFTADQPGIMDIAPTVLNVFGVPVPRYMEGVIIQ